MANLVYRVNLRTPRAIQRNCLENKNRNKQTETEKKKRKDPEDPELGLFKLHLNYEVVKKKNWQQEKISEYSVT